MFKSHNGLPGYVQRVAQFLQFRTVCAPNRLAHHNSGLCYPNNPMERRAAVVRKDNARDNCLMGFTPFVQRVSQLCVNRAEFSTLARNALRCPKCRAERKLALSHGCCARVSYQRFAPFDRHQPQISPIVRSGQCGRSISRRVFLNAAVTPTELYRRACAPFLHWPAQT